MNAFHVHGLTKTLGGRRVLDGIDLDIAQGEFVSIVGKSGCGKSTFLNCLAGFLPYEGELHRPPQVGFVFQAHALYSFMNCRANIGLGLGRLPRRERNQRVDEYLEIIGLPGCGDKYPWQLSGGESQRIAIARAFAPNPDAVLLDEPFSALDALRREAMMVWLLGFLAHQPMTILLVTHSIDEAILPANRVVTIDRGKVSNIFGVALPLIRTDSLRTTPAFAEMRQAIKDSIFHD